MAMKIIIIIFKFQKYNITILDYIKRLIILFKMHILLTKFYYQYLFRVFLFVSIKRKVFKIKIDYVTRK